VLNEDEERAREALFASLRVGTWLGYSSDEVEEISTRECTSDQESKAYGMNSILYIIS